MAVLPRSDPYRRFPADAGMSENVVRVGWLFHPPWVNLGQLGGAADGFLNAPFLIGIHHHPEVRADFFAHDARTAKVLLRVAAYLQLEGRPALLDDFTDKLTNGVVAE